MANYTDERGNRVNDRDTQKKVETTAVKARQGFPGRRVLMVLVVALALAAVAWLVAEQFGEAIDPAPPAATQSAPTADPATSPNQSVIDNAPPAGTPAETAPALADPTPDASTGSDTPAPATAN